MQNTVRDYQNDKSKNLRCCFFLKIEYLCCFFNLDKIKDFLNEFEIDTEDGYKASKYIKQIVKNKKKLILN
jgi:hypothetical protein